MRSEEREGGGSIVRMCKDCVFPQVRQCAQARCCSRGRLVKISDPLRLIPGLGTRVSNPLVPPGLPPRLACSSGRPCVSEAPRFELGSQIAGKFQCASPGSARDQGIISGEPPKPPSRHRVLGTRRVQGRPTSWLGRPPSTLLFHTARAPGPTRPIGNQIVAVPTCVFWLVSARQNEALR